MRMEFVQTGVRGVARPKFYYVDPPLFSVYLFVFRNKVYAYFSVSTWRERAHASPEVDRRRTGTTTTRTEQRSRSRLASHWVSQVSLRKLFLT